MSDTVKNWWDDEERFGKLPDKFTTTLEDFESGGVRIFKTMEELEEWKKEHPPKVPYRKK